MNPKEIKVGAQFNRAMVVPQSFNAENGTFDIVFATETPVFRQGWDENYNEILLCDPSNVRAARMGAGLNLLDSHPCSANAVLPTNVMGKISDCRFESRQIVGTVTLGAQCSPETRADIQNGIINTFSVGYNIYRAVRVDKGQGQTPDYQITDWEPNHVAIAPIPADVNSGTRAKEHTNSFQIENPKQSNNMFTTIAEIRASENFDQNRLEAITGICRAAQLGDEKVIELYSGDQTIDAIRAANPAKPSVNVDEIRAQATQAQKDRLNEILKSTTAAGISEQRAIEWYNDDTLSVSQIRALIIEEFKKGDPKPAARVGEEAAEKKARAIEGALLNRISSKTFAEEAKVGGEYRGMTLLEIGKDLLTEAGIKVRGMAKDEVARQMIGMRALSVSDFPLLLENVANKALRAQYQLAPEYFDMIARETSNQDFRAKSMYQIGGKNAMNEIPEGGELKYGNLDEAKQTIALKSYGEGLMLTRQMIINDDLSAFNLIPQKFVRDWNLLRGDLVWGMVINNVKMADGKELFHSGHANLAGIGAVLSDTTLTAALLAMKSQTDIDGKTNIRVIPKYLVVSPEYEITARKLLTVIAPTTTGDVNVWASMGLTLIVEHRLSGKAWYMAADPNATDGLYYSYLDGQSGLRTNREEEFRTDSINFGVRGDFGVAAIDHRGWYKNAGQ